MDQTLVGRLNKAFGIKGQIKVIPTKAFTHDLKNSVVWFIQKGNEHIPYFVESIEEEPHFLVKFEDVNTPEIAKTITGSPIWLRDKDIRFQKNENESELDKLIGFHVFDIENELGEIIKIEEFPQQLMAFIQKGEMEIMMPMTPEFITDIDPIAKRIMVNLPEGFVKSQQA